MTKSERKLAEQLLSEMQRGWGSEGGKKGSAQLSAKERKERARNAAEARWEKSAGNSKRAKARG